MKIETTTYPSPKGDITVYTLTNRQGAVVRLSSLGAGILDVIVPDRDGNMADVVLGYANPADYLYDGPCMGKVPGRYANRIGAGEFTLAGKKYQLAINNGPNALHGGPEGFQNQIWESRIEDDNIVFNYTSADGEEGYPGELTAAAIYNWNDRNELSLDLLAMSKGKTVVNLTNHVYFNLNGDGAGSMLDHELQLFASKYLETDDNLLPTGQLLDVKDTPMDFTEGKTIGRDMTAENMANFPALKAGKGYDTCYVIDNWHKHTLTQAARLSSPKTGRWLEVYTTQPGVQIYGGNWLKGCPKSRTGNDYQDYDGVAIECQGFPDAPNKRHFPCQILGPGERYEQSIVFKFGK